MTRARSFVSHIGPDGREGRFTPFEEVMHSTKPPFEQKSLPSNEKASLRSGSLPSKGSRRPGILVNAKIAQSRWQKRDERTHRGADTPVLHLTLAMHAAEHPMGPKVPSVPASSRFRHNSLLDRCIGVEALAKSCQSVPKSATRRGRSSRASGDVIKPGVITPGTRRRQPLLSPFFFSRTSGGIIKPGVLTPGTRRRQPLVLFFSTAMSPRRG